MHTTFSAQKSFLSQNYIHWEDLEKRSSAFCVEYEYVQLILEKSPRNTSGANVEQCRWNNSGKISRTYFSGTRKFLSVISLFPQAGLSTPVPYKMESFAYYDNLLVFWAKSFKFDSNSVSKTLILKNLIQKTLYVTLNHNGMYMYV